MENEVKDALLTGTQDRVLMSLIELTLCEVRDGRTLFQSPLDEPVHFRKYFKRWVIEGLQERQALDKALEEANKAIGFDARTT
jgi:hypothetical protein